MKMEKIDCLLVSHTRESIQSTNFLLNKYTLGKHQVNRPFPGAIPYLGSYLYNRNMTFDYIVIEENQYQLLFDKLVENQYYTIAISTTFIFSSDTVKEIASYIKLHTKAKIIIGGPFIYSKHMESNPREMQVLMRYINADYYVVSFSGEGSLINIINNEKYGLPNNHLLTNTYYKCRVDDKYLFSGFNDEINGLDEIINWELFEHENIVHAGVRTSQSCPFNCSFCQFPVLGGKYILRDLDSLEKELGSIEKTKSIQMIDFFDDTLNVDKKRFIYIMNILIRNRFHFQ